MVNLKLIKIEVRTIWKVLSALGLLTMICSTIIGLYKIWNIEIYSIEVIGAAYIGFITFIYGCGKLHRKRFFFYLSFYLGASGIAALAFIDLFYDGSKHQLSQHNGTFILVACIALISVIILKYVHSYSNKRRIYQTFAFIFFNIGALGILFKHLIYPGLHCYACPWASAGCPIGLLQNWVIMGEIPYYLFGSSIAIFTLFGRAFCGWACPFGFLHDILNCITKVKYKRQGLNRTILGLLGSRGGSTNVDKVGILTYVTRSSVLILLLYTSWKFASTWFCKLCPAGFIEAALPYRLAHNVAADPLFVLRVVIFFSLILIAVIVSRFWCRYFCPLGHVAGHFNHISMLQLTLDEKKCDNCGVCKRACPMELDPEKFLRKEPRSSLIDSAIGTIRKERTNCILCGECVEKCHGDALNMTFAFTGRKMAFPSYAKEPQPTDVAYSPSRLSLKKSHAEVTYTEDYAANDLERDYLEKPKMYEGAPSLDEPLLEAPVEGLQVNERPFGYSWSFPVTIDIFYKSNTELSRNLDVLGNYSNYFLNYFNIFENEKYLSFFNSHYKNYAHSPIIIVNGQIYLGSINDTNELFNFVEDVQNSYRDINIFCNCDDCHNVCDRARFSSVAGNTTLQRYEQYPLELFSAPSPGAILSTCPYGSLYALYGKNTHNPQHIVDHISLRMRENIEKYLIELQKIPVTTFNIYMKKNQTLSNDILNVLCLASFYSGGKLRYFFNEWNNLMPSVVINDFELPQNYYPSSFVTLMALIKKYGKWQKT